MSAAPTIYDEVDYPGHAQPRIHPRRLRTLAMLRGLDPPPVECARVLELGCGDGLNLLWIADEFRGARCVGVDLAESALARGRAGAAEMGLTNIELVRADLLDIEASFGEFDYIIAHGVYSWVPEPVRDQVLKICHQNLAPEGIAAVSYNAYPGCHLRSLASDAMRFHTARHDDPVAKMAAAREIAALLPLAATGGSLYVQVLRDELKTVESYPPSALFHDDLSEANQPVYLVDFVAHARRHRLHYLCDTTMMTARADGLAPEVEARITGLARDRVEREQYLDFVNGRRFRHSLLHRGAREPDFTCAPRRAMTMAAAAPLRHNATREQLIGDAKVTFEEEPPHSITLSDPLLKCALHYLGESWPEPLAAETLLSMCQEMAGRRPQPDAADRDMLGTVLYELAAVGFVRLSATPWHATAEPGERPCASALSRWQAAHGTRVTSHQGAMVELAEGITCRLVCLLDGTRTLDELADELVRAVNAGEVDVPPALKEAWAAGQGRAAIAEGLPSNLRILGRKGLLQRSRAI